MNAPNVVVSKYWVTKSNITHSFQLSYINSVRGFLHLANGIIFIIFHRNYVFSWGISRNHLRIKKIEDFWNIWGILINAVAVFSFALIDFIYRMLCCLVSRDDKYWFSALYAPSFNIYCHLWPQHCLTKLFIIQLNSKLCKVSGQIQAA